eukprot:1033684-Rhodomonas_salina.2
MQHTVGTGLEAACATSVPDIASRSLCANHIACSEHHTAQPEFHTPCQCRARHGIDCSAKGKARYPMSEQDIAQHSPYC